jgi:hypothetical protein
MFFHTYLKELLPFNAGKRVPCDAKFNENKYIYFFHTMCKILRLLPDLTVYISNTTGVLLEAGTTYPAFTPYFLVST